MDNLKDKIIDYKNDIIVANTPNIKVNIAKCCKPIMGDKIVGYVTKGEGVTVHKSCLLYTSDAADE